MGFEKILKPTAFCDSPLSVKDTSEGHDRNQGVRAECWW
jgi:hypothetical protein